VKTWATLRVYGPERPVPPCVSCGLVATRHVLLDTGVLAIGRFICRPGDTRWSRENWIGPEHHVVFPARSVVIDQAGYGRIVANPNRVVLYDPGRTYRRELLSPDGDVATYITLRPSLARELLGAVDDPLPRFARAASWLPAAELLRLHVLVAALERGEVDALTVEEVLMGLVAAAVAPVSRDESSGQLRAHPKGSRPGHDDLVHDTERLLSQRYAEALSLAVIGHAVGSSPYHLARVFRAATGQSLHAYREQIRLRTALDRLTRPTAPRGLAALASELGFASHSHLDARFRRAFGRPPSAVRAVAARGLAGRTRSREVRTILQGTRVRRN